MNTAKQSGLLSRLWFRAMLCARFLGNKASSESFAIEKHSVTVQRIYVINLDRKPDRWRQMSRELSSLSDRSGGTSNSDEQAIFRCRREVLQGANQ